MEEISIKVQIAGRIYPVTVLRDEEAEVREAANSVNKKIERLRRLYAGVRDVNDLLSMALLEYARESLSLTKRLRHEQRDTESFLNALNDHISRALD